MSQQQEMPKCVNAEAAVARGSRWRPKLQPPTSACAAAPPRAQLGEGELSQPAPACTAVALCIESKAEGMLTTVHRYPMIDMLAEQFKLDKQTTQRLTRALLALPTCEAKACWVTLSRLLANASDPSEFVSLVLARVQPGGEAFGEVLQDVELALRNQQPSMAEQEQPHPAGARHERGAAATRRRIW
eukprot:gene15556-biopygen8800